MEDLYTKLHCKDLNLSHMGCIQNVFEQIKSYAFVLVSEMMLHIFGLQVYVLHKVYKDLCFI